MTIKEQTLKKLEQMQKYGRISLYEKLETDYLKNILKDLERLEKQDKILDIIFKKNVDIELLKLSTNWLDYHTRFIHRTGKNTELTDEQYELLKEWLDNGKDNK